MTATVTLSDESLRQKRKIMSNEKIAHYLGCIEYLFFFNL